MLKNVPTALIKKWKFYIEKTFLRLLKNCLHKFHDFITASLINRGIMTFVSIFYIF